MQQNNFFSYSDGIRQGFEYLLTKYPECFVIGQGLWSPWYVGNTMLKLEEKFGKHRLIDTPVSESAVTGAGVGAALSGMLPIIVHPRIDFMLYAMDAVVNQAAKWMHMTGGQANVPLTIRAIINRGGEQGAQHSQALQSWFTHIPGLKVVMPYSAKDARDLLIASVLDPNPVIYIDDRWLYSLESPHTDIVENSLDSFKPEIIREGNDITIISSSYTTHLSSIAADILAKDNISVELINLTVLSDIDTSVLIKSCKKTKSLLVVDGGWAKCGISSEIISLITESDGMLSKLDKIKRITLPFAPAPTSRKLEDIYYITPEKIVNEIRSLLEK